MHISYPKNILVIKFCCLGDIVFISPALRALRASYPKARITILVSHWGAELIPCLPMVDDVIVSDAPYEKSFWNKLISAVQLIQKLRKLRPDIVFNTHRNSMFGLLAYLSGARYRCGFTETRFLTHTSPFQHSQYEVERYLSVLSAIGIHSENTVTILQAPKQDYESVDRKLEALHISPEKDVIVIFPGGGENVGTSMTIKRWYPERYVELIRLIQGQTGGSIILVGGKEDKSLCNQIASPCEGVINLAGELSIREIVALGKRCRVFLGSDSGPTHMIAATGAPTVALFGPTDPRLVAPRGKNQEYIWKQPACSPCYTPQTVLQKQYYRGRTFICHTGTHECIQSITVDQVWLILKKYLIDSHENV